MADGILKGTFALPWTQTIIDGHPAEDVFDLQIGMTWEWHGDVHRLDGPDDVWRLPAAVGETAFRQRVARGAQRLLPRHLSKTTDLDEVEVQYPLDTSGFVVTNGASRHVASVVQSQFGGAPLVIFYDDLPPKGTELWVADQNLTERAPPIHDQWQNLICFTPGTLIDTPSGLRDVTQLRAGDLVTTKDNGARPLLWTGAHHISAVRLQALPWMRPVLIDQDACAAGRPTAPLLVSPSHKMLMRHPAGDALFLSSEVLVQACHMVNGGSVRHVHCPQGVTYCHLMLDSHQILVANGMETESFHPGAANLGAMCQSNRQTLDKALDAACLSPAHYGPHARRALTQPEAALFLYEAA